MGARWAAEHNKGPASPHIAFDNVGHVRDISRARAGASWDFEIAAVNAQLQFMFELLWEITATVKSFGEGFHRSDQASVGICSVSSKRVVIIRRRFAHVAQRRGTLRHYDACPRTFMVSSSGPLSVGASLATKPATGRFVELRQDLERVPIPN